MSRPNAIPALARLAQQHPLQLLQQTRLTASDVGSDGAWVVVLEVLKGEVTLAADLVADGLASSAGTRGDGVRVAGGDTHGGKVRLLTGLVGVSSLLVGWALELGEVDLAGAGDGEGRGLKVLLLGEQENKRAGLARVRRRNVEVKDRAGVAVDLAVVLGAVSLVGLLRVDRYDEVGVLVVSVQISWAHATGLSRSGRSRRGSTLRRSRGLGCRGGSRCRWLGCRHAHSRLAHSRRGRFGGRGTGSRGRGLRCRHALSRVALCRLRRLRSSRLSRASTAGSG
jgi:hypothetical protein